MFDPVALMPRRKAGLRVAAVKQPVWKKIHAAADRYVPRFKGIVVNAARLAQEEAQLAEIEAAVRARDEERLRAAILPLLRLFMERLRATLPLAYMSVMRDSANNTGLPLVSRQAEEVRGLAGPIGVAMKFNVTNPRAVDWTHTRTGELITEIEDDEREKVQEIISHAFLSGVPPRNAAKEIAQFIPLRSDQVRAADNLRQRILDNPGTTVQAGSKWVRVPAEGATEEWLADVVDAYEDRLLMDRAEMIARTETLRASNEGQQELWNQAVEQGYLTGEETKEWIVTDDERLCDECLALDGVVVGLYDDFPEGPPPLHPNCRCTIGISTLAATAFGQPEETEAELEAAEARVLGGAGSGNFGHLGRPGEVGGSGEGGESVKQSLKPGRLVGSRTKAFDGKMNIAKMSKQDTGALGEAIVVQYLKDQGFADARPLNTERSNFPVDLVEDHTVYEVKTGLSGNGYAAQQWRATIGQPGPKERAWLARVSDRTKMRWNDKKRQAILERKERAVREVGAKLGHPVTGKTIGLIINPDKRIVDVHIFEGFHLRVGWSSAQAKAGYIGSFHY